VQLADDELGGLEGRRAVVVGTGRMAELVLLNLLHRSISSLVVCGRNPDRTERLAARFGAETVPLDRLGQELERADLIVAATGSPGVVLDTRTVSTAVRRRDGRPLLLLDLAVPRDVDPAVRIIDGCRLFDVDEIGQVARRSLGARRGESPRAEEIVAEEAASFFDWQRSLDVVPAIASLHRRAEDIRAGELARAEGRLAGLSPKERRVVESLTAQIVGKLLHAPTVRMKQAAAARDGLAYAHALQHLFALGEEA
jgi:glutamyl-tRNA reductase